MNLKSPDWAAWIQQAIIEDDELFESPAKSGAQVPEVPDVCSGEPQVGKGEKKGTRTATVSD
eukprot:11162275-Lingulodinium_polyedra.AAC.1